MRERGSREPVIGGFAREIEESGGHNTSLCYFFFIDQDWQGLRLEYLSIVFYDFPRFANISLNRGFLRAMGDLVPGIRGPINSQ